MYKLIYITDEKFLLTKMVKKREVLVLILKLFSISIIKIPSSPIKSQWNQSNSKVLGTICILPGNIL